MVLTDWTLYRNLSYSVWIWVFFVLGLHVGLVMLCLQLYIIFYFHTLLVYYTTPWLGLCGALMVSGVGIFQLCMLGFSIPFHGYFVLPFSCSPIQCQYLSLNSWVIPWYYWLIPHVLVHFQNTRFCDAFWDWVLSYTNSKQLIQSH